MIIQVGLQHTTPGPAVLTCQRGESRPVTVCMLLLANFNGN